MFLFHSACRLHVSNVYVHLQEDYIVHAALYGMFFIHLRKHSSRIEDMLDIENRAHPK